MSEQSHEVRPDCATSEAGARRSTAGPGGPGAELPTDLLSRAAAAFTPNLRPRRVMVRGDGCWLYDEQGRAYLDFIGGIGVHLYGHGHPAILGAIRSQAGSLSHHSALYLSAPVLELAEALLLQLGWGRIFFANSGTEAVEAGIKAARAYFRKVKGEDRFGIVATKGGFHGRTMGALSCTGTAKYQKGFEPLMGGVTFVRYGDAEAMKKAVGNETAAILVEPIQGEGGVVVPPDGYLRQLRDIADESGCLLFLDEVQTGMGRTGHLFAHHAEVSARPDLLALGKGLGGGLPLGALVAREHVAEGLAPGTHGSTMGGNPVACSAGLAGLRLLTGGLLEASREVAAELREGLEALVADCPQVVEVRGRGMMLGLSLSCPAGKIMAACLERGLLVNAAGAKVLRMLPPLVLRGQQVHQGLTVLRQVLQEADS